MENRGFFKRMLVIIMVFGIAIIGCDNGTTNNSDNTEPKKVSLTGFNANVDYVDLEFYSKPNEYGVVAYGHGHPYSKAFTLELYNIYDSPFTGNGSYYLHIHIHYDGDDNCYDYFYSNGKTFAQLGITESSTPAEIISKGPKYNIASAESIIPFNQFLLVPEGFMDLFE